MESDQPVLMEESEAQPAPRRQWRFPKWKFGPPFWTIASVISLAVNLILLIIIFVLGTQLFTLKNLIQDQVLGGLFDNFVLMDQAHIKTTIPVTTNVPAKFDLLLNTNTVVILTEDTPINDARVNLYTGGLSITNAPANIVLPAGTHLPIALNLTVPVDQMIPVNLIVEVDIPLNETELHEPFTGLQQVVAPYRLLLSNTPDSATEIDACQTWWGGWICRLVFGNPDL